MDELTSLDNVESHAGLPKELVSVLQRFSNGEHPAVPRMALADLGRANFEARLAERDLLRIVLVGQFKAGKSTLLNALLAERVAPVGLLRMTAWIARYVPSPVTSCRVVYLDGTSSDLDLADFLARCEGAGLPEAEANRIDHIDVGVSDAGFEMALVDCPGLGSNVEADERKMFQAVREADVVLWVCDATVIGGEREAALLRNLRAIGIPLIAALNKVDVFDSEDDRDEVTDYLRNTYGLGDLPIFPVSASAAWAAAQMGEVPPAASGLPALRDYLQASVRSGGSELRAQAEAGHRRAVVDAATSLVVAAQERLNAAADDEQRLRKELAATRDVASTELRSLLRTNFRKALFGDKRAALVDELAHVAGESSTPLGGKEIESALKKIYGDPNYIATVLAQIADMANANLGKAWGDSYKEAIAAELTEVQVGPADMASMEGMATTGEFVSPQMIEMHAANMMGMDLMSVAAAAGLLAVFFPIGGPLIGIAMVGAAFYRRVTTGATAKAKARATVDEMLDDMAEHLVSTVLESGLFPRLEVVHNNIEHGIISRARATIAAKLGIDPELPLDVTERDLRLLADQLRSIAELPLTFPLDNIKQLFGPLVRSRGTAGPVKYVDVAGMEFEKAEMRRIVEGKRGGGVPSVQGGVLLDGPPGTGKTLFAQATANEFGLRLIEVHPSDVLSKYFGESARNLSDRFSKAKESRPSLLFFDEFDAIGGRRGQGRQETDRERDSVVAELLQLMDASSHLPNFVVMAATNHSEGLDPALVRSGRFGIHFRVGLPDEAARRVLLEQRFSGLPDAQSAEIERLVRFTSGYTPARIMHAVDVAQSEANANASAITGGSIISHMLAGEVSGSQWTWDSLVLEPTAKAELRAIASLLEEVPAEGSTTGSLPGILLVGPPGTGKTTIARVIANESRCSFHRIGSEVVSKWAGDSEKGIREAFDRARAELPSVLFIDDIDGLAGRRDLSTSDAHRSVVSQLLTEMDGFEASERILVIGATNQEEVIDLAVRSRLPRRVNVGLPDQAGRRTLLQQHLPTSVLATADLDLFADHSEGLSGRDLKWVGQEAVIIARAQSEQLGQEHVQAALARAVANRIGAEASGV